MALPVMTAQALIPGAYERRPVTVRQPGSMGGPAYGSADAPAAPSSMDAATIAEHRKEGGGAVNQQRQGHAVNHRGDV